MHASSPHVPIKTSGKTRSSHLFLCYSVVTRKVRLTPSVTVTTKE